MFINAENTTESEESAGVINTSVLAKSLATRSIYKKELYLHMLVANIGGIDFMMHYYI